MQGTLLRRTARRFRKLAHVSVVLRQHARAQLDQISARRLAGRGPGRDPVSLDDLARESQPLVRARRLDRCDEVRQPPVHHTVEAAARRRRRDGPRRAGLTREPRAVQHQIDDRILIAGGDAATDLRVVCLQPGRPAGIVAGVGRVSKGGRRAVSERRDDRACLGERCRAYDAIERHCAGETRTDRRAHHQQPQKGSSGRRTSHQR